MTPSAQPSPADPDAWYTSLASGATALEWVQVVLPPAFGQSKQGLSLAVFQGFLLALGGSFVSQTQPYEVLSVTNDVYRTSDGVNWERLPPPPWAPRRKFVSAVLSSTQLFVMGGWNSFAASGTGGQDDDVVAPSVRGDASPFTCQFGDIWVLRATGNASAWRWDYVDTEPAFASFASSYAVVPAQLP